PAPKLRLGQACCAVGAPLLQQLLRNAEADDRSRRELIRPRIVLAEELEAAPVELDEHPLPVLARAAPTLVDDPRGGHAADAPAGAANPDTPVDFLAIDEELAVERAHLPNRLAPDH